MSTLQKRLVVHILILTGCASFFYFSGLRLEIGKTKDILSALQNIMAAVFALTGIWLAISYPEAISSYLNPKNVSLMKGSERTKRIEKITLTIFGTSFALIIALLLQWSIPVFHSILTTKHYEDEFSVVFCAFLAYISIIMIRSLFSVLFINFQIANDLHDKKDEAEAFDDLSD